MKPVFAIDPGNTQSAYVVYYPEKHRISDFGIVPNHELRDLLLNDITVDCHFAIEMIASYGMAVGATIFETCLWIGRFIEVLEHSGHLPTLVYRQEVKMHLCKTPSAKDSNIRQAIIDLFPATGGGKNPVIGTKSNPGPLYGVSADVWAALGVALTHANNLTP